MQFDFSEQQQEFRQEARRFLAAECPPERVRKAIEGGGFDRALWQGVAEMGFLGIAIPEEHGGLGLGYLELCAVAEEFGRALAPLPILSSIYLAAEAIKSFGTAEQQVAWLPRLAAGATIGCLAAAEGERLSERHLRTAFANGRLDGTKAPVLDGDIADIAIVLAKEGDALSLVRVDLAADGVTRTPLDTLDPSRGQAEIVFAGAPAERLGERGEGWAMFQTLLDRAAVLTAFEQIGGADRALEMGRDYALERMAFGRQIGSFQAIKHMLADMYVSATLARSNAYYGAWALSTGASELPQAAATARVSATNAFRHCAKNNIQVHGGMGFTWQMDCHFFYRRANQLALALGGPPDWEEKLVSRLSAVNMPIAA
ncbi:acyl-CoA dehydrogenase family protein [Sphingomonas radiodurans]|uniref:acyl-CoA dehydrogenase family protein n=1 Tax=Sphingomonas radiodurans TaxID=2890321 RepID=UPI001E34EC6A|nr:acyl-CoA dehydrogenase family protein [Sphingomonas radiodurans]WBH18038.1 acyl-CoA/acyl-ACP dehydrogenase [Sphingomonas radiodurans]